MSDNKYRVSSFTYEEPREFMSLGKAKEWPRKVLERQKMFALKYANDSVDGILDLMNAVDGITDEALAFGPLTFEGCVDKHSGLKATYTFEKVR